MPPYIHYIIQVSRLNLYYCLGKQYNEKKLYVENIIEGNHTTLGSVQYQHWFKRNYPVFNAEVEGIIIVIIQAGGLGSLASCCTRFVFSTM